MDVSRTRIGLLFCLSVSFLYALACREARAHLAGPYQTVPGATAVYNYQADNIHSVTIPLNVTMSFSGEAPATSLSATIVAPIIGVLPDGTGLYPIADLFPMRVMSTSNNSWDFHGNLLGSQYLFDWTVRLAAGPNLSFSGRVYWAGGRFELTTVAPTLLVPSIPGDYNQDGTVDAADFAAWRANEGTANALPNDPIGGTIGQAHYDQWRERYGQSAGSGAGGAVPEPVTLWMLAVGALAIPKLTQRHARPDRTGRAV